MIYPGLLLIIPTVGLLYQVKAAVRQNVTTTTSPRTVIPTMVSNCANCGEAIDELAKIRLEQIKREILEKLGLDEPPQIRPSDNLLPSMPQIAKYLRNQIKEKEENGNGGKHHLSSSFLVDEPSYHIENNKLERTIIIAEPAPVIYNNNQNSPVAYFKFSSEITSKLLQSALLNVYLKKPSRLNSSHDNRRATSTDSNRITVGSESIDAAAGGGDGSFDDDDEDGDSYADDDDDDNAGDNLINKHRHRYTTVQIIVKEVLKNGKFGAHIAERKRLMDLNKEGYVQVALRVDDVQRWWDGEKGKNEFLGLHVQALYKNENLAVHPQPDLKLMHLELTTFDEYSRKKRSYQEVCTREMNEPSCCLYSLVVDFDQAGWDFVIAPKVYDAHMCSGECRLHYVGRSAHSKITSSTTKNAVSGCCHPTEYDPIKLIYMTQEHELKIKEVPGMIARRCTCA